MTDRSDTQASNLGRYALIIAVVAVLYMLGFNYYVSPNSGDDVVYYHGAVSLADGEGYKSQGMWIQDWPPVQSLIVATTMFLSGSREYYLAKLVNLCAAALALVLAHRLMEREQRQWPTLACLLIAISPTSLMTGTGGQADFTFFALSMVYFLLLRRLSESRSWSDALLCGIVLGIASLTRWQGVLLGVALVFQALSLWKTPQRNSAGRELLASSLGALIFLAWKYWLYVCTQAGTAATSNYQFQGVSIWWQPAPLELGAEILNVFTQLENVVDAIYPSGNWLVSLVALLFWIALAHGFYLRVRRHGCLPTDAYVVVTLLMYVVYAYKEARYAIPLAPFLLDYLFTSAQTLVSNVHIRRLGIALLALGLLTIDGVLLFYGDGHTMGPRSQLLLEDERSFLRGHDVDLYDACQKIKQDYPEATLACDKFHTRIVRHYTGQPTYFPGYTSDQEFDLFLEVKGVEFSDALPEILDAELELPPEIAERLSNPEEIGQVVIWQVE